MKTKQMRTQTAVEFIVEQLDCLNKERKEKLIDAETYFKNKKALIEQSKELEKQQIIDACNQEECFGSYGFNSFDDITKGNEYYNFKFK